MTALYRNDAEVEGVVDSQDEEEDAPAHHIEKLLQVTLALLLTSALQRF